MSDREHWSPSSLNMFLRCPRQWYYCYIEDEPRPPGMAMIKGKSIDGAATANFEQKIETHEDLPGGDIVDMAVDQFDTELAGGYELNIDERRIGQKKVVGQTRDSVARMAAAASDKLLPEYQPVMVQQKFRIYLSGPRDLLGIIDFVDDMDRVVDIKTASRKKRQDDVNKSIQLSAYWAGFKAMTGREPTATGLDTLVQTRPGGGVSRQQLLSQRTERDMAQLARTITDANKMITAGNFPRCAPDSWCCSKKWCGWWHLCPFGDG